MFKGIKKLFDSSSKEKKGWYPLYLLNLLILLVGSLLLGVLFRFVVENIGRITSGEHWYFRASMLLEARTWLIGVLIGAVFTAIIALNGGFRGVMGKSLLGGDANNSVVEGALENSRFLTDEERDKYFPVFQYDEIDKVKKDGVPARAVLDKKGKLVGNFKPGVHALVIGATGSGKTTTFINPMIQLIGATNCGSSMIMTDPKGELFDLHSAFLKSRGYNVMVLDLRDTYSSSRWNPLEPIWDAYQEYLKAGSGIIMHLDPMSDYPDLRRMNGEAEPGERWVEYDGKAYLDLTHCQDDVQVAKQKIYDEMYEDLSDLIGGLIPIQNEKDPLWEKGARSIVMALCLAMLEDSENPALGMTKEKYNLFNINKALGNSENEYQALKDYFEGRSKLSQAYQLSRQVMTAPDTTLGSYMSITFDKLNLFNDRGHPCRPLRL